MVNSYEITKFSNGSTTNQRFHTSFFIKYRHIISYIRALDKDGSIKTYQLFRPKI